MFGRPGKLIYEQGEWFVQQGEPLYMQGEWFVQQGEPLYIQGEWFVQKGEGRMYPADSDQLCLSTIRRGEA